MSLANVRMKVAKVKGGLIGGPLAIARLAVMLPVLLSLLVPFGSASVTLPMYEKTVSFGGIGLYRAWTDHFRLDKYNAITADMFNTRVLTAKELAFPAVAEFASLVMAGLNAFQTIYFVNVLKIDMAIKRTTRKRSSSFSLRCLRRRPSPPSTASRGTASPALSRPTRRTGSP